MKQSHQRNKDAMFMLNAAAAQLFLNYGYDISGMDMQSESFTMTGTLRRCAYNLTYEVEVDGIKVDACAFVTMRCADSNVDNWYLTSHEFYVDGERKEAGSYERGKLVRMERNGVVEDA